MSVNILQESDKDRIVAEYLDHAPLDAIASGHGVSRGTIRNIIKERGVAIRPVGGPPSLLTESRREELLGRHEAGEKQLEIAHAMGVSYPVIRKWLDLCGIPGGPPKDKRNSQWKGGIKVKGKSTVCVKIPKDHAFASMADKNGYVTKARLAVAEHLGRSLTKEERIRFRNGDWNDLSISNLEVYVIGRINVGGYWAVKVSRDDPMFSMANKSGRILEHRLVMARHLGRPLRASESVHHINGYKCDNLIDNLQLRNGMHGSGIVLVCACCGSHDIVTEEIR